MCQELLAWVGPLLLGRHSLVGDLSHFYWSRDIVMIFICLSLRNALTWCIVHINFINIGLLSAHFVDATASGYRLVLILKKQLLMVSLQINGVIRISYLPNMILRCISCLTKLVLIQNTTLICVLVAAVRVQSTLAHWIIPSKIRLIDSLELLGLGCCLNGTIVCCSSCKALSTSWLALPISWGTNESWLSTLSLLMQWDLLSVIAVEKVDTCVGACSILEVNLVSRLANALAVGVHLVTRSDLLVHLSLSLLLRAGNILWMPHLIILGGLAIMMYLWISRLVVTGTNTLMVKTCFTHSRSSSILVGGLLWHAHGPWIVLDDTTSIYFSLSVD